MQQLQKIIQLLNKNPEMKYNQKVISKTIFKRPYCIS